MPQNFITNITIKLNKQALDTTFENLILHDSLEDTGGKEKIQTEINSIGT